MKSLFTFVYTIGRYMGLTYVTFKCGVCGKSAEKKLGHYNRAKKTGSKLFCSRKCFGKSRFLNRSEEEKKRIKSEYDKKRTDRHELWNLLYRGFVFRVDYEENPEKYRKERQRRMKSHVEYCRKPEYRKKKKIYDQHYRAKKFYGDFGEAAIALWELAKMVDNRKAKKDQQIYNKSQKRKRNAKQQFKRKELESSSVGIYQPS